MSHHYIEGGVSVTAHKRAHPAICKLARACIALARRDLATARPSQPPPNGGEQREVHHD